MNLPQNDQCCGCTACASICPHQAISMGLDEFGFVVPKVDSSRCVNCRVCEKVCPVLHPPAPSRPMSAYSLKASDEIRVGSASGGAFALLAKKYLDVGGVVYGAGFESESWRIVHKRATIWHDADELRGSKYSQSDLSGIYPRVKNDLMAGSLVLFTGCPCQIAGLKSYLGEESNNLVCVDLICDGVASPMGWDKYLQNRILFSRSQILTIYSRRFCDWKDYNITIKFCDGSRYQKSLEEDMFLRAYSLGWLHRNCCFRCKFKNFSSGADISIGDCWTAVRNEYDSKGISLVVVHSEKGKKILFDIKTAAVESLSLSAAFLDNGSVLRSKQHSRARERVLRKLTNKSCFDDVVRQALNFKQRISLRHYLWWIKRLIINGELNPFWN